MLLVRDLRNSRNTQTMTKYHEQEEKTRFKYSAKENEIIIHMFAWLIHPKSRSFDDSIETLWVVGNSKHARLNLLPMLSLVDSFSFPCFFSLLLFLLLLLRWSRGAMANETRKREREREEKRHNATRREAITLASAHTGRGGHNTGEYSPQRDWSIVATSGCHCSLRSDAHRPPTPE